jgi:hypothetical protein
VPLPSTPRRRHCHRPYRAAAISAEPLPLPPRRRHRRRPWPAATIAAAIAAPPPLPQQI